MLIYQCLGDASAQAVIGNYAVPILEDKTVWGTNDDSRTAYMDTQVSTHVECCAHSTAQPQGSTAALQCMRVIQQSSSTPCVAQLVGLFGTAVSRLGATFHLSLTPWAVLRTASVLLQDIARLTLAALQSDACENRTLTLAGPSAYTTREVIDMCERMSDSNAKVTSVPTWLLRATRNVLKSADWARDAADRLVSRSAVG
jgi:hypothetical protein